MSARQRPHTFTVCIPVSQSSVPLHRCFCVCVHDSFIVVMYFYLGVCVAVFFCFFLWVLFCCCDGEVTESIECACVDMCGWFLCLCVDQVASSLCFLFSPSNATWRSLKLMGPPVASLLIVLHPSPLGRVLAARPRPPYDLRAGRAALPLLAVLCLLVVFRSLAAQQTQILLSSLGVLAPCRPVHCRSAGLLPWPALWWTGLLLLGVRSFRLQRRVGAAGALRSTLTVAVRHLHPLLFALLLPNSIAELLHAVEVRVVQERQEVAIPQPVFGRVSDLARRAREPG